MEDVTRIISKVKYKYFKDIPEGSVFMFENDAYFKTGRGHRVPLYTADYGDNYELTPKMFCEYNCVNLELNSFNKLADTAVCLMAHKVIIE